MPSAHRGKLFVMMVLQFAIWGAWLPLIFGYLPSLQFTPAQQSWILNAFPLAAIVGMFFSNQFADRSFAAERFLAFSHLVSGAALLGLGFTRDFWPFLLLMSVHCLLYVPTISITNSIAFAHLRDPQREFGLVRMGGTIGWILAAWPFVFLFVDWQGVHALQPAPNGVVEWLGAAFAHPLTGDAAKAARASSFLVAGAASLLLALFSLTLPHTPPRSAERLAWLKAFRLLGSPYVLVLWLVAFVDSFVHNCYFNWAEVFLGSPQVGIASNWTSAVMSIGQVAEILTMFVLGATLRALGWRATMVVGILGHAARFAVFAWLPQHQGLVIAVFVLHGICYAFFFAAVYIFVDAHLPKDIRSSAQGLFNLMILGVGALLANSICPWLRQSVYTHADEAGGPSTDFTALFQVPLYTALGAAVFLAFAFRPPAEAPAVETAHA